jgi:hypothetical protein
VPRKVNPLSIITFPTRFQEPILLLLNSARAFFKLEENIFVFKTLWAIRNAGVVTRDRRIGSCFRRLEIQELN